MNRLSTEKRVQVVSALVEGNSINDIGRMTGVAKHRILGLLRDIGCAAAACHHRHVRSVRVRRLQCDEIWWFVGAKRKNVSPEQEREGWGDVWTWIAIDADTSCVARTTTATVASKTDPYRALSRVALTLRTGWAHGIR